MKKFKGWSFICKAYFFSIPMVLVGVLFFFLSDVPAAQGGLFSVGVAKVDITPREAIRLAGYASRRKESQGVASKIWAKALVIDSDDQKPRVLITAELIRAPGVLVESLAARLKEKMGLERSQLTVCVTHTHSGPALSSMLVDSYFGSNIPAAQKVRIEQYTDRLLDLLEQLVLDAINNRQPSQLAWSEGAVGFAVNRRMVKDGKWVGMRPNEEGAVDHALPVLRVLDAKGKLRALFLSYACHGTTYGPKFNKIHGDWAGAAAQMLEERYPDCITMVALGCGGDANPKPRGVAAGFDVVNRHGRAVADEVERLLEGQMSALKSKPDCKIKRIELSVDHVPGRDELQQRLKQGANAAYFAQVMLDRLDRGEVTPATFSYPIQVWNFGEDLSMVFLAGEVVAGYSLRLKRESGRRSLWINAYSNDDSCYIATKKMIPEGGYEVDQSMDSFAKASRLSLDVEDKIVEATLSLLP